MNWERITAWAEVSDCGRYSVAMVFVHGRYVHEAWRRATAKDHARELLASCNDPQDAKKACEQHAQKAAA